MKTYIIRFTTKGMKNLDNFTSIDFYNKSISKGKEISMEKRNIKGIFGNNGAGKTAYILAMDIYINIVSKKNYLMQNFIKNKLDKLINKTTKNLFLENIFAVSKEDDDKIVDEIFKHTVVITPVKNLFGEIDYSIYEKLEKLAGNTINTQFVEVYRVELNKLIVSRNFIDNGLVLETIHNKLEQSTLSSLAVDFLSIYPYKEIYKNHLVWYIYNVLLNAITTNVYVDSEDVYEDINLDENIFNGDKNLSKFIKNYNKISLRVRLNEDIVKKNKIKEYEKQVGKLKEFIKILKPNLKDIKVDKKFDGENYHCRKQFVYDNYYVDEEYESTGIKKIIKIYSFLCQVIKGNKVFIDELDANISGIFLDKLLDFIAENGKGQLCFTTHNVLSMDTLKKYRNGITVIGETGKVVNVVKNGHYQPVNLYYDGFIEDSPFNFDTFDFFKSFDLEG